MTQSAQQPTEVRSILLRSLLAVSFAAVLALAPAPAFAQHGGGGGGSHGGGGGGGGSHGGGSSGGGHASGGSAHSSSAAHGTSSGSTGGGHWWNPFHSGSANSGAAPKTGAAAPVSGASSENKEGTPERFAATNNVWQDPPATHGNARSNFYANSNRVPATSGAKPIHRMNNGSVAEAARADSIRRRRPIIIVSPFFPGFGFGFGSFGFGYGFGCDPFWGWWGCPPGYGFGYGYGAGFGYGDGFGYFGGASGLGYGGSDMNFQADAIAPNAGNDNMSFPDSNAGNWQSAPDNASQPDDAKAQPYVVIFLRDGTSYAVSDYWLAAGKLHYVTSYGGENSVDANQLNLQRTVNENAAHGIDFTLRPSPATDAPNVPQSLQPPSSHDNQAPASVPQ